MSRLGVRNGFTRPKSFKDIKWKQHRVGKGSIQGLGGDEIIERVKEVIKFIKSDDNDKAVLYLNYIIEDIEMYKNNSL